MSSSETYARVSVYDGSTLLMEQQTIEMTRTTGSQKQVTVQKDYGGESPGAAGLEITFTNAVPVAGAEVQYDQRMTPLTFFEMTLVMGDKTLTTTGCVYEDSLSAGVDSPTKSSIKFRGSFAQWK